MKRKPIRLKVMCEKFGCSAATIWRRVADGTLPPPVKIGGLTVWDESEVDSVIEAAFAGRDPEAA